jgi:outer membrane protein assembly factor BamB
MKTEKNPNLQAAESQTIGHTVASLRGNILVYLVFVLLIFGVLGVTIASLFSGAVTSSATPNDARRARYLAESGIRYALSEVRNSLDLESTAVSLNTRTFEVNGGGTFEARVFSLGLQISNITGSKLTLDVPYQGEFPAEFSIPDATVVDWQRFKGPAPDPGYYAAFTVDTQAAGSVTIDLGDSMSSAKMNDTVGLAVPATEVQSVGRGGSIRVAEEAKDFFPSENGAIRIVLDTPPVGEAATYEVFYETAEPGTGYVELKNIRELPGGSWPEDAGGGEEDINLTTADYVVLSPYNIRVFATGISGDATVEIGKNKAFSVFVIPSDVTIYMKDLVSDEGASMVQSGGVVRKFTEEGSRRIELGKGATGSEGFGTVWYGGDKPIGGDANFCQEGRCILGDGIRVFFTAEISGDGEGFTFALIAGGDLTTPVNTRNSAGGDYQLPELLAYGGAGLQESGLLLDPSQPGLLPPKMALEFDTRTNLNIPLDYCTVSDDLEPGSRNDPQPGGTDKDVLQYVFWGSNDAADLGPDFCRSDAPETYDDNRHDAEGKGASLNFTFDAGAAVRSGPTYDPTDGTVYFGSDAGSTSNLWAVNTEDGSLKWEFTAGINRSVTCKPALDTISGDRFVYFSASDDKIYKMKADPSGTSGEQVWAKNVGGNVNEKVSPAVSNISHDIYIGSNNNHFYAFDSNGIELWNRDLGDVIQDTATVDKTGGSFDGNIYVGTNDESSGTNTGKVFGFDPDAVPPGTPLWPFFPTNQDIQSQIAINADGTVIYPVTDVGFMYALPTATGGPAIWIRDLPAVNYIDAAVWLSGPAPDGTIYVPTDMGALYALNPANGNNRPGWPINLGATITYSSPAVGPDGAIYIGTNGNSVFAINPDGSNNPDGFVRWEFLTGGPIHSSPDIGEDGVVYVGSNDGNLYAIANVALPRNYRNTYVNGQGRYLTSEDLDSDVSVQDINNWLNGALARGPWAIRVEIERAQSINANLKYEYTLRTWIRQCAFTDCVDIKGTPYQDTTVVYDATPASVTELPFTQVIELTQEEHDKFERMLFGFTTAASSTDTQLTTIADFQLTFARPGLDPVITDDPAWNPQP